MTKPMQDLFPLETEKTAVLQENEIMKIIAAMAELLLQILDAEEEQEAMYDR